jgi:hypothetical protein
MGLSADARITVREYPSLLRRNTFGRSFVGPAFRHSTYMFDLVGSTIVELAASTGADRRGEARVLLASIRESIER